MSEIVIKFLYELFARFGIVDLIVTDNGSQFTSKDFNDFCKIYQIKHVTTVPFHLRSNGQAERIIDTLKRALKKASAMPTKRALQQFLQVYRISPNMKTPASQSPNEVMFARRIWLVYDKLLQKQTKPATASIVPTKKYYPGEKVYFKMFKDNKSFSEAGMIEKRIGNVIYIIKWQQFTHKRYLNQIRKRSSNEPDNGPAENVAMDVIYDIFDILTPLVIPEVRCSKRKWKATDLLVVNLKRRRY